MMTLSAYRSLTALYPKGFRTDYRDDLVQHFADLVDDRGARAAWARTAMDLIVTVPRYRMESIMTEPHTTTTIGVAAALCAFFGVMSILTGIYPGALLLIVAVALIASQRSSLARAIRAPGGNRRRNCFATAGVLGVIFVAALVSYMRAVGQEHVSGMSLVLHNAIGVPAMVGFVVFLIVGLVTPRAEGGAAHPNPAA